MSMHVTIDTNSKGSGDWIVVSVNDEIIFSGHSIAVPNLVNILESVNGFEFLTINDLTDEEIVDVR